MNNSLKEVPPGAFYDWRLDMVKNTDKRGLLYVHGFRQSAVVIDWRNGVFDADYIII